MQFQKKYELTSWKTRETIISGNGKYEGQVISYVKSNLNFPTSFGQLNIATYINFDHGM